MIIGPAVRWSYHFRPMSRGTTNIMNITRNYNTCCGGGCGGGMSWLGGLFMLMPMAFMGIRSLISLFRGGRNPQVQQQQLVQPQAQQEQPQVDKDLEKLKTLFKDIPWVAEGNGKYTGVKDGKSYRGTYEEILTQLANPGQAREREEITTIKEQAVAELDGPKPGTEDPNNPIDKTADDGVIVKNPANKDKKKDGEPVRLNMTMAIQLGGSSDATVVTPDGKTHKISLSSAKWVGLNNKDTYDELGKAMKEALAKEGWTNVVLENKNFEWSSDGSEATGEVSKPKAQKGYSTEEKLKAQQGKHHDFKISFAVHSKGYIGNSGSATVTTPDGKLIQVTTGMSLTPQNARDALVKQMKQELIKAGWTDFTLVNPNEGWVGDDPSYKKAAEEEQPK